MSNAEYLTSFVAEMQRKYLQAQQARQEMQVNTPPAVPPVPPLIDQLRDLLATLPAQRISLPLLLPHLKGKYRDRPHLIHASRAMKQLGYRQIRSWKKADHGHRYWTKN